MLGQPSETTFGSKIPLGAYFTYPKYSFCPFRYSPMPTVIRNTVPSLLSPTISLLSAGRGEGQPGCQGASLSRVAPAVAVAAESGGRAEGGSWPPQWSRGEGGGQPAPVSLPTSTASCRPSGLAARDTGTSGTFRADHTKSFIAL